jgi:type VI secretion system FHA domain protein
MPTLRLELETTGEARRIASGTLTIGRGSGNDWALPAADGPRVSRRHCSVSAGPEGFAVADLGSTNGTRLNGRRLEPRARTPLASGDVLELGPYRLMVTIEAAVVAEPAPVGPIARDSFDQPMTPRPPVPKSPAATPAKTMPQGPASLEDVLGSWGSGDAAPPGFRLSPQATVENDPLGRFLDRLEPLPRSRPLDVPETESCVQASPQYEALPSASRAARSPGRTPATPHDDPFGLAQQSPSGPPLPNNAAAAPPRPRLAPERTASDADGLVAAFLEGAGLDPQTMRVEDARTFLRDAGAAFSGMSEGLRELLSVRALIKDHARLNRTQIRARENNPLKFSTDAREATQALLQERGQGYMPAAAAIEAACRDLMAHELALLDGIQAAVGKLLQSFDPTILEGRLADAGTLGLLLQGGRRAKLWELYGERYTEIANAARARFMGDFDQAFRAAYERKIAEFAAAPKPPSREGGK